jgi:hypothetical protein
MQKLILGGCAVVVALIGLVSAADAAVFVRGGFGPRFHGGVFIGPRIGFGFYNPWWAYPYPYPYPYYAPPPLVVQTAPAPAVAPANGAPPGQNWYYCNNPQGYYPYVRACNGGWQTVPAGPDSGPPR